MMRDAGITSVRTDAHWAYVERRPNQLKIEPSTAPLPQGNRPSRPEHPVHPRLWQPAPRRRRKPHRAGPGGVQPLRQSPQRGFQGSGGLLRDLERMGRGGPARPQVHQDYARLIADAAGIVRQRDPAAKVLAGAVTTQGIESGFALRLLENGLMQSVDGLSLHPYVHCRGWRRNTRKPGSTGWPRWTRADPRRGTARAALPHRDGLALASGRLRHRRNLQAAYGTGVLPRRGRCRASAACGGTTSATTVPTEPSASTTSARSADFTPKPAYRVLTAVSDIVANYRFIGREENSDGDVVALRFARGEDELLVAGAPASRATRSSKRSTRNPAGGVDRYGATTARPCHQQRPLGMHGQGRSLPHNAQARWLSQDRQPARRAGLAPLLCAQPAAAPACARPPADRTGQSTGPLPITTQRTAVTVIARALPARAIALWRDP